VPIPTKWETVYSVFECRSYARSLLHAVAEAMSLAPPRATAIYLVWQAGDRRLHLIEWSDVRARLNRRWSPCESSSSFGGIGRVPHDVIAKDEYSAAYSAVVAGWYGLNL
jgi:hypothetical protein